MVVVWVWMGIFLIIGSVFDWKRKALPGELLILGVSGTVICNIYLIAWEGKGWMELAWGFLPGVAALLLAVLTREQLGYGDGCVLLLIGGCLTLENTLRILFIGLLGAFVGSVLLLILRKGNRSTKLPFVPFLFIGYVVVFGGMWR